MEMIPIVSIISSMAMVVLVVYFVTQARQRRVEAQVEMQNRLVDKFGSAPELIAFLQSPAGRQFVAGVQTSSVTLARERIMTGFTRSIVLTALGLGFLFLTWFVENDFVVPAAILTSLGLGYFIASFVSFKLSSKLQLGGPEQPGAITDVVRT